MENDIKKHRIINEFKYIIFFLCALFIILFLVLTISMIQRKSAIKKLNEAKELSYTETYDNLFININESLLEIEYGSEYNKERLVTKSNGEVEIRGFVDTSKVGEYPLKVLVSTTDEYNQTIVREFSKIVKVVDTYKPLIEIKNEKVTLLSGDTFRPENNINIVYDKVDGEYDYEEVLKEGSYTVESDIDNNKTGIYEAKIIAKDKNGNESEAIFQVEVVALATNAKYPYYIKINRVLNNVTIYAMDSNGEYSIPFKAMVCSTGTATPLGTYKIDINYRWRLLNGNVSGQYATRIVRDILFHSVPYFTRSENNLEYEEYNKLGTTASQGCIRLAVIDAKWIYDNCPLGTTVEIYDDEESPGPLGKPTPIEIDITSPNKGWDPTDPNPNNPWNKDE